MGEEHFYYQKKMGFVPECVWSGIEGPLSKKKLCSLIASQQLK
jgi:hypothetical protein